VVAAAGVVAVPAVHLLERLLVHGRVVLHGAGAGVAGVPGELGDVLGKSECVRW
jgi:hypothetical protein